MSVVLRVIRGEPLGARLLFPPGQYLFGRAAGCHVRFAKTSPVSGRHCLLCVTEEAVSIRDLHSRNGTAVNRERLRNGECALHDGDELYFFSEATFLVEIGRAETAGASPRVVLGQALGETMASPPGRTAVDISIPGSD
jgi:predicted component of type VI protein secretion system